MRNIINFIRAHLLVRIFLMVVLSVAAALVLGSGLRPSTTTAVDFNPPAKAQPASASSNNSPVQAQNPVKNSPNSNPGPVVQPLNLSTGAFDKAVRTLGGVDRAKATSNVAAPSGSTNNTNKTSAPAKPAGGPAVNNPTTNQKVEVGQGGK